MISLCRFHNRIILTTESSPVLISFRRRPTTLFTRFAIGTSQQHSLRWETESSLAYRFDDWPISNWSTKEPPSPAQNIPTPTANPRGSPIPTRGLTCFGVPDAQNIQPKWWQLCRWLWHHTHSIQRKRDSHEGIPNHSNTVKIPNLSMDTRGAN